MIPTIHGKGRKAASEVLINTPLVSDTIKKGDVHALKEIMTKSTEQGMQTFDQALFDLIEDVGHLSDLCSGVTKELEKEGHVVQIEGPVRVFGDIHGQSSSIALLAVCAIFT